MTVKQKYEECKRQCRNLIRTGCFDTIPYMSGSKRSQTTMMKMIENEIKQNDLDNELLGYSKLVTLSLEKTKSAIENMSIF